MGAEAPPSALTDDAVLGGRLKLYQPARGHRVGHDAILLAASTAAAAGDVAVDLGAGVGAAGLALASRSIWSSSMPSWRISPPGTRRATDWRRGSRPIRSMWRRRSRISRRRASRPQRRTASS
jgi:hypothetical protein